MNPSEIAVVATGGTIACVADENGALVPRRTAAELIDSAGVDIPCRPVDVRALDSSSMTLADIDALAATVREQLADPSVAGVVVTHGTDSLTDTAFALDLFHSDPRPVVVTGAQRAADSASPDGPGNLRAALTHIARTEGGTGRGALSAEPDTVLGVAVAFGGRILPARGLVKADTHALDAFRPTYPDSANPPERPEPVAPVALAGMNVPIIAGWAGAEPDVLDAVTAMAPDGIVIEGMGSGNVSEQMGEAVHRALDAEIPVVVTTVVPHGKVEFSYGGAGGGATLGDRGAVPAGWLCAGQARIALAAALSAGIDPRALIGG
ncbi:MULTISPECIES: asparaginase [unclassified Corynebacterium]|uniref:asparaginase n=1 Tax=unclassified Corynebacterium TaxID=2624378 RepID=UPI00265086C5|nr:MULTISPECIES: asparaginase [unclassified Corynebacterium]MDN8593627.1 asparaginase [Corynebacterium sp. P4_F2]WKK55751.1 asparaginase [Corynebacterium sp. P4-C1]WKK63158.1 asparaginase [Corynebacterium sp. P8-C1]